MSNTRVPGMVDREARFRDLIDQLPIAAAELNLAGGFTLVNEQFRRMIGYRKGEAFNRNIRDLIHPDDLLRFAEEYRQMVAEDSSRQSEMRLMCVNGDVVQAWCALSLVHSSRDLVDHAALVVFVLSITYPTTESSD